MTNLQVSNKYLSLTEFEDRTVSYGPSFFPAEEKNRAINRSGKKRGSVTYSTDRENEVSKIFIISLECVTDSGKISIHAERLQISAAR